MYGAIIGDVIGSVFEHHNIKSKDFPLFSHLSRITDDTVMTVAVGKALLRCVKEQIDLESVLVREMQRYGRMFPDAGYGGRFRGWIKASDPRPYKSYGNGSAMRASACGLIAASLTDAEKLGVISASVTHNHLEGMKGAKVVAAAVYLAKSGSSKEEICDYIAENYYPLDFTLDEIRPDYGFDVTCQGSVPQAIVAFRESCSFEDAIRNAVSIGGDSDTIAAITGSIAWAYYGRDGLTEEMEGIRSRVPLPDVLRSVVEEFELFCRESCVSVNRVSEGYELISYKRAAKRIADYTEEETQQLILSVAEWIHRKHYTHLPEGKTAIVSHWDRTKRENAQCWLFYADHMERIDGDRAQTLLQDVKEGRCDSCFGQQHSFSIDDGRVSITTSRGLHYFRSRDYDVVYRHDGQLELINEVTVMAG